MAAKLVAGFVAFDAGADATRLESACTLFQGCASNPQSRRAASSGCVAALERGENVGAGVQGALNALDDPTLLVEVGPAAARPRLVIASRVAAAAVRIGGEGPARTRAEPLIYICLHRRHGRGASTRLCWKETRCGGPATPLRIKLTRAF